MWQAGLEVGVVTMFVCPKCGGTCWVTKNSGAPVEEWVRYCKSPDCDFSWPIAEDSVYLDTEGSAWTSFKEKLPAIDEVFDVWVTRRDAVTKSDSGYRVCDCWPMDPMGIVHTNAKTGQVEVVYGATHWMMRPDGPEAG